MSITSRRALLGALAVIPAIAAPAGAAVANPDAVLLKLGVDLQAAEAVRDAARAAEAAADARYEALLPEPPAALRWRLSDPGVAGPGGIHWNEEAVRKARAYHADFAATRGVNCLALQRCDEILAAIGPYDEAAERASSAAGLDAATQALERADEAVEGIAADILEVRALTAAGRALKARIALTYMRGPDEEPDYGSAWARSVLADVIATG
jgi:hypothetical protein